MTYSNFTYNGLGINGDSPWRALKDASAEGANAHYNWQGNKKDKFVQDIKLIEKKCVDFVNKVNTCNDCVSELNACLTLIENMRVHHSANLAAINMLLEHKEELTASDVDDWTGNAEYHAKEYNTLRIKVINKINGIIGSLANINN